MLVKDWTQNKEMRALDMSTGGSRWTASNVSNVRPVVTSKGVVLVKDWDQNKVIGTGGENSVRYGID